MSANIKSDAGASFPLAAVIGGVVGGLVLIIIIVLILVCVSRRKKDDDAERTSVADYLGDGDVDMGAQTTQRTGIYGAVTLPSEDAGTGTTSHGEYAAAPQINYASAPPM